MEVITWCLVALVLFISFFVLSKSLSTKGEHLLPPGPRGLPLLGCPWALRHEFHNLFTDLAKTYGDIVSINIMGKTIVGLNSAELVRKAFNSPDTADTFAGRGPAPAGNEELRVMTSFIQPGPHLSKQRKLIHKILNHYGEGLRESEQTIQEELTHVLDWLGKAGASVNIDDVLYPSLINVITILLIGRRYDYLSPVVRYLRDLDEYGAQASSSANTVLLFLLPFLKRIPIGPGKLVLKLVGILKQFHRDYYEESKATYDPNVTRGMLDFLFHHQGESRLEDGSVWLEDNVIRATIQEMLTAGIQTTRGALYAFFLIIAHKPEVATKIHEEIDTAIGGNRFPNLEDRGRMHYTMAAMLELLRYISHVPLGLLHQTTDDVTIEGYFLPKHTTVVYNSWNFHHDEKTFADPWEFKPERFLDNQGHLVAPGHPSRRNAMPFGTGRRSCVGEVFAKSRMFLFITTILQRFNFTEDPARPLRSCDPRTYRPGIVISPYTYYLKVTSRG